MPDVNAAYSVKSDLEIKIVQERFLANAKSDIKGLVDAVQSGAQAAALKVSSLFTSKNFKKAPPASASTTPEQAKQRKPAFVGALVYPADLQYYTRFSFKEYNKKDVTSVAKDSNSVDIILPLPANLTETFAVEYATPALGPVVGAAAEGIIKGVRQGGAAGLATAVGKGLSPSNLVTAGEAGVLNGLKSMGGAGEVAAQIGSMALGVAPNPHLAVIFSNIGLRSHKFSYKFAPRSEVELKSLKNILYHLKRKMLPGLDKSGGMLFSFPDVVDIKFMTGRGNAPYIIKRCVMESLDVNYSPAGSPAFFKTGDPVMVEISMLFKEMSPFTRDDVVGAPAAAAPATPPAAAPPRANLGQVPGGLQYDQMGNVIG